MSDFVALYTAFSGLRAAQTGMDTASHNIANAGTAGFTRQRVDLATHLPAFRRLHHIGTGVDIVDISRARHAFLDDQYRAAAGASGRLATLGEMLDGAERVMGEPANGVTASVGGLWTAFEELALDPTDDAARLAVIGSLDDAASTIRSLAIAWDASAGTAADGIAARTIEANALLEDIAALNSQIAVDSASGSTPGDLLDARDMAVDRLATLTGSKATVTDNGMVRVSLNGLALVHDVQVSYLSFDDTTSTVLHSSGATVTPGGEIAGLHTYLTGALPSARAALDDLARDLADALNAQHAAGFTPAGAPGGQLLTYVAGSEALTLTVGVSGADEIAAAGTSPVADFDALNAEALAGLRDSLAALGGTSTLDGAARTLATSVGQALSANRNAAEAQGALTGAAEGARIQAHGVSIDEEMVDLITFQRAYEAAARVMTTIDQSLDTLINRTGIVGR